MAADTSWQQWFEQIWAFREETLYRGWFGDTGKGIYCLSADLFRRFNCPDPDPRWLHHGVFACPPSGERRHWAYVSSGLSNPWGQDPANIDPKQYTGLGLELVLLTPNQAEWPIMTLTWFMAGILLVAAGKLRGALPEIGDRIPLGSPVTPESPIRHFLLAPPPEPLPIQFKLDSGMADLMLCVGITDAEAAYARENTSGELLDKLQAANVSPMTDAARASIL